MTKTELIDKMDIACEKGNSHRLYSCKAEWVESQKAQIAVLFSYGTLCAVYWKGIVWEFDQWSNTTTSHVRKFARLMDAPVISLYRRSGMSKRDFDAHMACDWSDVIDAVLAT